MFIVGLRLCAPVVIFVLRLCVSAGNTLELRWIALGCRYLCYITLLLALLVLVLRWCLSWHPFHTHTLQQVMLWSFSWWLVDSPGDCARTVCWCVDVCVCVRSFSELDTTTFTPGNTLRQVCSAKVVVVLGGGGTTTNQHLQTHTPTQQTHRQNLDSPSAVEVV